MESAQNAARAIDPDPVGKAELSEPQKHKSFRYVAQVL